MDAKPERLYSSDTSHYAAVAQWIEYWPPKPRVVGSIPASRAIPVLATIASKSVNQLPMVCIYLCNTCNYSKSLSSSLPPSSHSVEVRTLLLSTSYLF
jgi:hypothetical protein